MASVDLSHYRVVIAVFQMPDCGACEAYLPRLRAGLRRHGRPFQLFDGKPLPRACIPVLIYDAADPDPAVQAFADRYAVAATPTTLVLRQGPGAFKVEGGLDDNQIDHLLTIAREANR